MTKKVIQSKTSQAEAKKNQNILPDQAESKALSATPITKQQSESINSERKLTLFGRAQLLAPILSLIVALTAIGVSAYYSTETLYQTFRTPFSPIFTARPIIWLIKPQSSTNSFTVNATVLTTISNEGAIGGVVDGLVLEVSLPKGKWYLVPFNFIKPDNYYVSLFEEDKPGPPQWLESPFTPIYIAGRSQVTKAIMFLPSPHPSDNFDFNLAEVGQHPANLYAGNKDKNFKLIAASTLEINQDDINAWRSGKLTQRITGLNEKSARSLLGK